MDKSGESAELPVIPSRGAGERSTAKVDGQWAYEIVYHPTEVLRVLERYAAKRAA